jgi:hypothetical protein
VNRIRALLSGIFPGLERVLDLTNQGPLILLTAFQTPAALRQAGADQVRAHLVGNHAYSRTLSAVVTDAMAAGAEQTIAVPGEQVSAALIGQHAGALLELGRRIKVLDRHIAQLFVQHEHAARITSVIGFGPALGARSCWPTRAAVTWSRRSAPRLGWPPTPAWPRCRATRSGCRAT